MSGANFNPTRVKNPDVIVEEAGFRAFPSGLDLFSEQWPRPVSNGGNKVIRVDRDMRIVWAKNLNLNPGFDVVGQLCYKVYKNRRSPCPGCLAHRALCTGNIEKNIAPRSGNDGDSYWESTAIPLMGKDGVVESVIKISSDVTEFVRAEQTLKGNLQLTSLLMDQTPNPIIIHDSNLKVTYVNPAHEQITGFSSKESLGLQPPFPWWPKDKYQEYFDMLKTFSYHRRGRLEKLFVNKSGECFWAQVDRVRITENNKVRHYISTWTDITERKRIEQDRLQALYENERKLRLELENEIKKRTHFTRILVHELKTPLTPMMASSESLANELTEGRQKRLAGNIYRGTKNLNQRIEELMDFARSETGILDLNCQMTDPLCLLKSIEADVAMMFAKNRQHFSTDLPPELPSVYADEARLRQIVLNLINNATRFTPEGGEVCLRARVEGDCLVTEVSDTGCGIGKDRTAGLFEPYEGFDGEANKYGGFGVGLPLCKKLVELHNGHIWFKTEPGSGSTFSFSLPLDFRKNTG